VGLLFSIQKCGVGAVQTTSTLNSDSQVDAEMTTLADSVQMALADSGLEAGSEAHSELKNMIQTHVQSQLEQNLMTQEGQKTNLDESNQLDLEQKVSTETLRAKSLFYFNSLNKL